MNRKRMRAWILPGAASLLLWGGGCGGDRQQLLVVYSGDCQAYVEPCG